MDLLLYIGNTYVYTIYSKNFQVCYLPYKLSHQMFTDCQFKTHLHIFTKAFLKLKSAGWRKLLNDPYCAGVSNEHYFLNITILKILYNIVKAM